MTKLLTTRWGVGINSVTGAARRGLCIGLLSALTLCTLAPQAQAEAERYCTKSVMRSITPGEGIKGACLWVKADKGGVVVDEAKGLTTWVNQVDPYADEPDPSRHRNLYGRGSKSPLWDTNTAGGLNFNPAMRFNGVDQAIGRNTPTIGTTATVSVDAISVFFVSREQGRKDATVFSHDANGAEGEDGRPSRVTAYWPRSDGTLYWRFGLNAGSSISASAPFKSGVPNLGLVTSNASDSGPKNLAIFVNAKEVARGGTGVAIPAGILTPGSYIFNTTLVGSSKPGTDGYRGIIPELLEFNHVLKDIERERVQSYLALKYGLTLYWDGVNGAYISSYGGSERQVVYSHTDKNGNPDRRYWNGIFGIGHDPYTQLDQRVSQSMQRLEGNDLVPGDSPLIIATGPNFTLPNGAPRRQLANGTYLVLGDNDGKLEMSAPTATQRGRRLARVWHARTNNTTEGIKDIYLGFDPDPHYHLGLNLFEGKPGWLYVSTDPEFGIGSHIDRYSVEAIPVDGRVFYTPVRNRGDTTPMPITIKDSSYLTLAQEPESVCSGGHAAGVADACLWLKADDAGTPGPSVTTWQDRSGNVKPLGADPAAGYHAPELITGSALGNMNFNPVVRFNGTNQALRHPESTLGPNGNEISLFFVNRTLGRTDTKTFTHTDAADPGLTLLWEQPGGGPNSNRHFWRNGAREELKARQPDGDTLPPHLGLVRDSGVAGETREIVVNGRRLDTSPNTGAAANSLSVTRLGHGTGTENPGYHHGDIPELLEFKRHLSNEESTRVQSYLALKYGLTLDRDGLRPSYVYTNGKDEPVYSHRNYWNSIFGIGNDSDTSLDQRVSRSTQKLLRMGTANSQMAPGDSPLILATTADFAKANNDAGRTPLTDGQYLVLGDDDGALNTLSASAWGRNHNRLPRVWRAQNTRGVGPVFLGLEAAKVNFTNTGRYRLFVESGAAADGSFPVGRTRHYLLSNKLPRLMDYWVPVAADGAALAVDIPNGAYLSYGTLAEPQLSLTVQSRGDTGTFGFSGTNGFVASSAITRAEMQPVAASPATQTLSAPDVDIVITVAMPAATGWRLEAVSCIDRRAAISGNPSGAVLGRVSASDKFTIPAAQAKASADLHCTLVVRYDLGSTLKTISGRVFVDNGAGGGGVANDGKINGAEAGRSGVALSLTNCNGTTHAATSSGGDGSYSLQVLPTVTNGPMCIAQTLIDDYRVTQGGLDASGVDATGVTLDTTAAQRNRWRFNYAGADVQNLHIGNVPSSRLLLDGWGRGIAGGTVDFPHSFIAGTAGRLTFAVTDASPAAGDWSEARYRDTNCNAQFDVGDTPLNPDLAVAAGARVCVIVRQSVPVGLGEGATRQFQLQATFKWDNAALPSETLKNLDRTTVDGYPLRLYEEVRNVSRAGELWSTYNSAKPGEILEYRTTFTNLAADRIDDLVISGATPNYTTLHQEVKCPDALPAGMGCTVTKPVVGGTGPLRWQFTGPLSGGASGAVTYQVKVNE